MAERGDHARNMVTKQADEDGLLVLRLNRFAFVVRIANGQVCVRWLSGRGSPARGDRNALDCYFPIICGDVDAVGLVPCSNEGFPGSGAVVAAFGLCYCQRGQGEIGGAGYPIRQIPPKSADDVDLPATVKAQ